MTWCVSWCAPAALRLTVRPIEWDPACGHDRCRRPRGAGRGGPPGGRGHRRLALDRRPEAPHPRVPHGRHDAARRDDGRRSARRRPVLLSGSAIGYYGDHGDRVIDESTAAGDDFPARVCSAWEACAQPRRSRPAASGSRSCARESFSRPTAVLSARQLPFFKLGLGGTVRSGHAVHELDLDRGRGRSHQFLLTNEVAGPVNLVAPAPVTNAEFTTTLGAVLHRPTTILPMTGPRVLFGRELADSLLLTSQRLVPDALRRPGSSTGTRSSELRSGRSSTESTTMTESPESTEPESANANANDRRQSRRVGPSGLDRSSSSMWSPTRPCTMSSTAPAA